MDLPGKLVEVRKIPDKYTTRLREFLRCGRRDQAEASGMLTSQFAGSHIGLVGKEGAVAMKKKTLMVMGLTFVAAVVAVGVRGDAAEEIGRLAELMGWKAGIFVADIGAGDGKYTFAAV